MPAKPRFGVTMNKDLTIISGLEKKGWAGICRSEEWITLWNLTELYCKVGLVKSTGVITAKNTENTDPRELRFEPRAKTHLYTYDWF